jgi:hypothetical protein
MFDSVKLADGKLCMKCFLALGFDKCMRSAFDTVPFDRIKDGADSYFEYCRSLNNIKEDPEPSFSFSNYGQERDTNETDPEAEIFDIIKKATKEEHLRFVRKSNNYVSAAIGPTDVARFKFTKRAKWILLPYLDNEKHPLQEPIDVYAMASDLVKAVDKAKEINNY